MNHRIVSQPSSKQPSLVLDPSLSRKMRYAKSPRQVSFDDNVEEIPPPPPFPTVPSQIVRSPPRKRRATMVRSKSMLSLVDMEQETTQPRKHHTQEPKNHSSSMKKRSNKILPSSLSSHPAVEHWPICESPDILFPPIAGLSWGQFVELSNTGDNDEELLVLPAAVGGLPVEQLLPSNDDIHGPTFMGSLPLSTYCCAEAEESSHYYDHEIHTISPGGENSHYYDHEIHTISPGGESSHKKRRFSRATTRTRSVLNQALGSASSTSTTSTNNKRASTSSTTIPPRPPSLSPLSSHRSEELVAKLRSLQVQSSNRSSMAKP